METSYHRIAADAGLAEVEKALRTRPHADLYVTDGDQILMGFITLASAWDALAGGHEQTARELTRMPEHILTEDTNLNRGFKVIEGFVGVSIPVVENMNSMRLTGIIHEANIIQAYNDAVRTVRREEQGIE
jgi:Mg/Co/Ni transporter MgtE